MRRLIVMAGVTCGIAAVLAVTSMPEQPSQEDRRHETREVSRLRAHFDSVLAELEARDVTSLRPSQRRARADLIRALAAYRDAGVFPHNHDFPDRHLLYFRDDHGTLCAMAHLIATTGRHDIVDAVAEHRNNAFVPELASDARFVAWLDSVGFTVAEAARVQPVYGPRITVVEQPPNGARYALPSLALGLPALVASALNWSAPREKKPGAAFVVGALSGAASVILGGAILVGDPDSEARALGIMDLTFGSAALVAAIRRSVRHAGRAAPPPAVAGTDARLTVDLVRVRHGDRIAPARRVQLRF